MTQSKQERVSQITVHLQERFHLEQEQIEEMLPSFIQALSSHLEKLESAHQSGNLINLGKAGHTMKGALLNLGLNDCVDIALEIELKGKVQDTRVDYGSLLQDLRKNLEVLFD